MAKGAEKTKDAKEEDVEVDGDGAKAKSGGKKKTILIIVGIVVGSLVLLGGTIGGTVYFMNKGAHKAKSSKKADAAEADAPAEDAPAEDADSADSEASDAEDGSDAPKPSSYVALDPAFVVNFEGNGPARFLQISVEVMTRKADAPEHIKKHMPVIRNNLVLLFSSQTYDKVSSLKGKEELRQAALAEVQKILEQETGDPGVEALYFTSFVMQ